MSTLDAGVHVWVVWAWTSGRADCNCVLEQVLLYPHDNVARLVERCAVNEQAGNLALAADGDKRLLGIGIGRDIALGDGQAVIGQEALDLYAIRAWRPVLQ